MLGFIRVRMWIMQLYIIPASIETSSSCGYTACRTTAAARIQPMCTTGSFAKNAKYHFATNARRSSSMASCRPCAWQMTCGQAMRHSAWRRRR